MTQRRFGPLMVLVVLGAAVLVARLFHVQVAEHEIWSNEAANLVRTGTVVPYRRGSILDTRGREWVRDEEVYRIEFTYRDFRRGHPLGLVAHARGILQMRAVPLWEARARLSEWALELVELSPSELRAFATGGTLSTGSLYVGPTDRPESEQRSQRARDLRFYVGRLLEFDRADRRRLAEVLAEGDGLPSFLELTASWRPGRGVEDVRAELLARLERSLEDLELWAERLGSADGEAREEGTRYDLDELLADVETWRVRVEDAAAGRLFLEASGFPAGRIATGTLEASLDLEWLAALLRWDAARTHEWLVAARARWLGWRRAWSVPTVVDDLSAAHARSVDEAALVELLLDRLGNLWSADPDPGTGWRAIDELVVADELTRLVDAPARALKRTEPGLPLVDPRLRGSLPDDPWSLVVSALEPADDAPELVAALRGALVGSRPSRADASAVLASMVDLLEERFQGSVAERLALLQAAARGKGRTTEAGRLRLAVGRLDRAAERARFVLKDHGSRPTHVALDPEYGAIHLLTRFPERFAGFVVRDDRVRTPVALDDAGLPLAEALIGKVRRADVIRLHRQRRLGERLRELQRMGTRTPEEDRLLGELVREVTRPDEQTGGGGVEGYFDPELRGRNGYRERRGLEERRSAGARPREAPWDWHVHPVDGLDVVLTLDADLQLAAQRALEDPAWDPDPAERDEEWIAHPVGAIVLITAEGDVLAAASVPTHIDERRGRWRDHPRAHAREKAIARERSLTTPLFQPLGSVFKPFVAARALEVAGFDPARRQACDLLEDGRPGYVDVHCWKRWSHGNVDLREALRGSCNAYFARLGESLGDVELIAASRLFGFGEGSGVRSFGERSGLVEHASPAVQRLELTPHGRRLAGNGLGVIVGTPMQVARATAGLATGRLPDVRLVREIGGRSVPVRSRPVGISEANLGRVRDALRAVVAEPGGTAFNKQLDDRTLGFTLAAKTGSADIEVSARGEEEPIVRKHTWVAAWFPAERPRAVLVVLVYDTTRTSSHGAVWVAQQLLTTPELQAWMAES